MSSNTRTLTDSDKPVSETAERFLLIEAITALRFVHDFYALDVETWATKYHVVDGATTVKAMRRLTGKVLSDAGRLGFKGDSRAAINMVRKSQGAA